MLDYSCRHSNRMGYFKLYSVTEQNAQCTVQCDALPRGYNWYRQVQRHTQQLYQALTVGLCDTNAFIIPVQEHHFAQC